MQTKLTMKKSIILLTSALLFVGVAFASSITGTVDGVPVQVNTNTNGTWGLSVGANANGLGFGQTQGINGGSLLGILALLQELVVRAVPFLIGLAVVAFFWFLVSYIWRNNEDPKKKAEAAKSMAWSILAIFVMVSIWGIISFFGTLLGIGHGGGGDEFRPMLPGEVRP
jgi:Type IV secretion system pilin